MNRISKRLVKANSGNEAFDEISDLIYDFGKKYSKLFTLKIESQVNERLNCTVGQIIAYPSEYTRQAMSEFRDISMYSEKICDDFNDFIKSTISPMCDDARGYLGSSFINVNGSNAGFFAVPLN